MLMQGYYHLNPIRVRKKKPWVDWTKEQRNKYNLAYRKANPDKVDEWRRRNAVIARRKNKEKRNEVFLLLGNKCRRCGFNDFRALQIDHINGNGIKDKKEKSGLYIKAVLKEILAGSKKYQLLCANCNWIKREERHECKKITRFENFL
jgi:hypothetical protein